LAERNPDRSIELEQEPDLKETALVSSPIGLDEQESAQDQDGKTLSQTQGSRTGFKALVFDVLETLLLTIIIYAVLSTFVGRFKVLSVSMEPTLYEGQYLLISKQTHKIWPLRRGDVLVFQYPRSPQKNYIKRLIGLPGEKIELRNGELYINDKFVPEPWLSVQTRGNLDSRSLGQDEYFVMGDNRNNSSDSRTWGSINSQHIIGKAIFRYWPFSDLGLIQHGAELTAGAKPTATPAVAAPFESILTSPLPAGASP
jgi:signal peptidase I